MSLFTHPAAARQQFVELAAGDFGNADLARGALLVALEEYPRLDVDEYLGRLDDIAARATKRGSAGEPAVFRLGHLHAELFDVDGYQGDAQNYYDPRNAYLNEVIDRRRGLPISLSVVFLHVAQRLGLQAHGVGLPGHFIVKVQFELNELYLDPFHGGATLTLAEVVSQFRVAREHLRAWSARETLTRVLANLQGMYARAGEPRKAAAALERMALLNAPA